MSLLSPPRKKYLDEVKRRKHDHLISEEVRVTGERGGSDGQGAHVISVKKSSEED